MTEDEFDSAIAFITTPARDVQRHELAQLLRAYAKGHDATEAKRLRFAAGRLAAYLELTPGLYRKLRKHFAAIRATLTPTK